MSDYFVAVTGGIASGKTTVTRHFEALGVVVVDADVIARAVVAPGTPGLAEVVEAFGSQVLAADGQLDRAAMRRHVFTDVAARRRLEAIIHPQVRTRLHADCIAATGAYAIASIPLLAEGGGRTGYPWLDRILVVDVPTAVQHERLVRRDGVDAAMADAMLAAQSTRLDRLGIADDVMVNDGTLVQLGEHVDGLHALYLTLSRSA